MVALKTPQKSEKSRGETSRLRSESLALSQFSEISFLVQLANKTTVFVLKTVVFLTFLVNPLGGLGQFKSFQKRKHMLRKMAAGVYLFCEDLYGGAGS